jgi:hypothetical protein
LAAVSCAGAGAVGGFDGIVAHAATISAAKGASRAWRLDVGCERMLPETKTRL